MRPFPTLCAVVALVSTCPACPARPTPNAQRPGDPATRRPSQLRISFGEDPATMMRVVWQTKTPVDGQVVEYGTSPELGATVAAKRVTYPYETGAIYEATLSNLKSGTVYYYRVGGAPAATHTFRTAPADPDEFTFTAFGDHGVTPDAEANVQNVLDEKPAFHLLLGDLSYANGTQPVWDEYLAQIEPMTSTIPYMPALGNHENERLPAPPGTPADQVAARRVNIGYMAYLARFALPGVERWYSFDFGPARFVAFNSDDYTNPEQLAWLEKTLAAARADSGIRNPKSDPWLIVYMHHPLWGTSRNRNDNAGLIRTLAPIFDRYKVDLVLTGHDHHYERQYPLRGGKVTSRKMTGYRRGEGTLYVKHGGGGKSHYEFTDPWPEVCAHREKTSGYLRVTVRKDRLTVEARRLDRSLIERAEVRR